MMSRATRNSLIFAGTMGIVRRSLLDSCGWDELCITEDAELGLRLAVDGYRAEFVNESFGHGLMPFDYESLKRQRHRWAFGGIQILLKYRWALFGSRRGRRRKLTFCQRYDYTVAGVHWLESITAVAGTIVLGVTSVVWMCGGSFEERETPSYFLAMPLLMACARAFLTIGALRLRSDCPVKDAIGACWLLASLTWTVCVACLGAFVRGKEIFYRTPKYAGAKEKTFTRMRWIRAELFVGVLLAILGGMCGVVGSATTEGTILLLTCVFQASTYLSTIVFLIIGKPISSSARMSE